MGFIECADQIRTALVGIDYLKVVSTSEEVSEGIKNLGFFESFFSYKEYRESVRNVLKQKVQVINVTYACLNAQSDSEIIKTHFAYRKIFEAWNKQNKDDPDLKIEIIDQIPFETSFEGVSCFFETANFLPLILDFRLDSGEKLPFKQFNKWLISNGSDVKKMFYEKGALLFRGVDMTMKDFSKTFEVLAEKPPQPYPGLAKRSEVVGLDNVYMSGELSTNQRIPCHTECVMLNHKDSVRNVPEIAAFYCSHSPEDGGETTLASLSIISKILKEEHSDIWSFLDEGHVTYCSRMSLCPSFSNIFFEVLDPNFKHVKTVLGTVNKDEIERRCQAIGLECDWSVEGQLRVINREAPTFLKPNQDSPKLYGCMLHLDDMERATQEDPISYGLSKMLQGFFNKEAAHTVEMSDGTSIPKEFSKTILKVIESQTTGVAWKEEGDVLILNNHKVMHGKNSHIGYQDIYSAFA